MVNVNVTATIRHCIARCADTPDARVRGQAQRRLAEALARDGDPLIAANVAAAARRLGEFIAARANLREVSDAHDCSVVSAR